MDVLLATCPKAPFAGLDAAGSSLVEGVVCQSACCWWYQDNMIHGSERRRPERTS